MDIWLLHNWHDERLKSSPLGNISGELFCHYESGPTGPVATIHKEKYAFAFAPVMRGVAFDCSGQRYYVLTKLDPTSVKRLPGQTFTEKIYCNCL